MGARDGENRLAHFRRQVLPIELLSDPSVHLLLVSFVPFVFFVVQANVFSVISASSAVKTIRCHLCANSNLVQMFELE